MPSATTSEPSTLVAGGAGFLGSNLCIALINQGSSVVCLDNLSTGKKENVAHLLDNPNFTFIEHNLTQPLSDFNLKINLIYHLAGDSLLVNSLGTYHLLELAQASSARFVLASTAFLNDSFPSEKKLANYLGTKDFEENQITLEEAKHFAETLTAEYVKKHNLTRKLLAELTV